jgi:quinol monooxygenase YgiN
MKGYVSWVNELAVKDGKLEMFRQLMEEMVSGTSTEPGTFAYEWYITDDGGTVHVVETYANSAAVVAHHVSEGFALQNWAGRFMDCVDVTRVVVYGNPNAAAREILDRLGATYCAAWGGFSRFQLGPSAGSATHPPTVAT